MFLRNIFLKSKTRIVSIATVLMALALPVVFVMGSASADSFCNINGSNQNAYCLTTQGGAVTACQSPGTNGGGSCYFPNADWQFLGAGGGVSEIYNDNYANGCIGDSGNNSGDAKAGIDECPTQGNAGWGTKFYYGYCSVGSASGYIFENVHWSGSWLGPQSETNNAQEYLNKPSAWCFVDNPYV
jgi:hypothetical protein